MVTLPHAPKPDASLTNPLTLLGVALVFGSVVVAGLALLEGDVVTGLGMSLTFVSGVLATGIGLSDGGD